MQRRRTLFAAAGSAAAVATLGIAAALSNTSGCVFGCDLVPGGVRLNVPDGRGLALVGVVANGTTCHTTVDCTRFPADAGGFGAECNITADQQGTCRIEASFNDTTETFTHDVVFRAVGGSCPTLVADPPVLDVPPRDAGGDGADGADGGGDASGG